MAEDYLLQAALGALEGFNTAYQPYQKAKAEDGLMRRRQTQQRSADFEYQNRLNQNKIAMEEDSLMRTQPFKTDEEIRKYSAVDALKSDDVSLKREQISNLQDERSSRKAERKSRYKADVVSKFNSDKNVTKYQASIDAANQIEELANSGNPIGAAAVPTFAARMAGEVGALTEADKAPFGGSRAIVSRMDQALQQMSDGKLTDENRKFIIGLSGLIKNRAKANRTGLAKNRAKQYSSAYEDMQEGEVYEMLDPQEDSEIPDPVVRGPGTAERILNKYLPKR